MDKNEAYRFAGLLETGNVMLGLNGDSNVEIPHSEGLPEGVDDVRPNLYLPDKEVEDAPQILASKVIMAGKRPVGRDLSFVLPDTMALDSGGELSPAYTETIKTTVGSPVHEDPLDPLEMRYERMPLRQPVRRPANYHKGSKSKRQPN